ncbi:MAG: OmpA family protein [Cyclobacteriaceae bacterium]|nr:OmpA family protein [Cyclobacteriaceae bacterium]
MRIAFVFSILFLTTFNSNAQTDSLELSGQFLEQADEIYRNQREAILIAKDMYVMAADYAPDDVRANWMAGRLYVETINKAQALQYFLRVKALDSKYRFDIDYQIGLAYQYGFEFDMAIKHFELYSKKYYAQSKYRGKDKTRIDVVKRKIEECKNAKLIVNRPAQYSLVNLGENINSPWPDYAPIINEDETVMIFTSRRQEDNTSADVDADNFYFEDVFISRKEGGKWGVAKNIGSPINTSFHDSSIALSKDGNRLYIYKDTGGGDIYYSDFIDGNWTKPKFLSSKINSSSYGELSITESPNGDVLLYSSERPGGEGGIDIHMISKNSKGEWYKTKSLGSVINTKGDEDNPFLDYDGKTLYFSSNGHKGYGGFDIFKSVFDSVTMTWSKPENLGYPVNTPDNELSFHPTKDGRRSYFASVREGGVGFSDIFMVNYHGEKGSDKEQLIVSIDDLIKESKQNDIGGDTPTKENKVAIPFEEHEVELISITHQIYFDASQSYIQQNNQIELNKIIKMIKKHNNLRIDVSGYASMDGNPKYNLDLSHKRAMIVFNYLTENGVEDDRIVAKGYGSLPNAEGGDGTENRRADVKVIATKNVADKP